MTTIKTLETTSTDQILEVFNHSFSDYIVPLSLTKTQLEEKIKSDGIKLDLSVGVFENNQLIAFILHGNDIVEGLNVAYNAGTGVIPTKRGNKLTSKMCEFILPIFLENNIDKIQLEVITTNIPAIKTYRNVGFEIIRELHCYNGSLQKFNSNETIEIRNIETYNWEKMQSLWDFKPSWQNSIPAVEKLKDTNISLGIFQNSELLGYVIYNPTLKRINQLAIAKTARNKGFGSKLLDTISKNYGKEISVMNVEETPKIKRFIEKIGLNSFINQYEMELILDKI